MDRHFFKKISSLLLLVPLIASASPVVAAYNASDVLGQPDYTSRVATTTASGLNYPFGLTLDTIHHRLFVSDCSNKRILVYGLDSNNYITNHLPTYVLGQNNFTSNVSTSTQTGNACPEMLNYDSRNDRLFFADANNNRVLIYDLSQGITNGMPASYVIGQSNFTSNSINQGGAVASTTLYNPDGLAYAPESNTLFVSDLRNYRILAFNLSQGITNGMPASNVLGQPNFISNASNQGGTLSAITLNLPFALSYDSIRHRLFVDDDSNFRVLIFDLSAGITNNMPASYVLGQPNMTTRNPFTLDNKSVNLPEALAYDELNDRLFVTDDAYSRVLVFELSSGITNYMAATGVIGVPDFTTDGYTLPISRSTLLDPELGSYYDSSTNRLWMTDNAYNRVLAFDFVKLLGYLKDGVVDSPYSDTILSQSAQGTVTYTVSSGTLPAGLTLSSTTGAITGTPTTAAVGYNTFTVQVSDNNGAAGAFIDRKQFRIGINAAPARSGSSSHGGGGGGSSFSSVAASTTSTSPTPSTTTTTVQTITTTTPTNTFIFTKSLRPNTKNPDVLKLQQYLNQHGFTVAPSGPGSPGQETNKFGKATRNALWLFQKAHALPASGRVDIATRQVLNSGS